MKHPIIAVGMMCLIYLISRPFDCYSETGKMVTEKDKISYSLGYQIGSDYNKQQQEIDSQAFLKGIEDSLEGSPPAIATEQMTKMLADMKRKVILQQEKEKQEIRQKFSAEAKKFFEENAKKEGVVSLPSGLQYKILKQGMGKRPAPDDRVTVNYTAAYIDGTVFGETHNKQMPKSFIVGKGIPGLKEGLQLMAEGSEWEFYIPADLAYGRRGPSANRAVIFDIELLSVESSK